ncbi:hypothetical protein psal_cds_20 [Pandoravirus salinus]|uniref:Uncharacterized protein n=1 Tax=Pandoravirus salinus TaxID=1349410 RepID=S4VVE2_9VIRU|nr:hypothetical protein psal_cds_20 [Pandoravirus salinus]AGO83386.1 hypothetical protein psal_cds_20 [Pandoravirus salinus]
MDIIIHSSAPSKAKTSVPTPRIPRDIAALFAACAKPGTVDLNADPKPVPTGALLPCEGPSLPESADPDCTEQGKDGRMLHSPHVFDRSHGLPAFDRSTHRSGSNNLITGNRRSGKSTLLPNILCSNGNRWDVVVAMCPALESQDALRGMFPASCVHDKYDPAVINKIISTARALREAGFQPRILLVLDDCMLDRQGLLSKEMQDLYMNSHYLGIEVYNVASSLIDISEALRWKVDYAFMMGESRWSFRVAAYKSFGAIFPTFEEFAAAIEACTKDFGCMVSDNSSVTGVVGDSISFYRGSVDPPIVPLGSHAQWLLHYMFYNEPERAAEVNLDDPIPALTRLGLID